MKKILILGSAPLPFADTEITYASGIRTWQILSSLIKNFPSYKIEAYLIMPPLKKINKDHNYFYKKTINNCSIYYITLKKALSKNFLSNKSKISYDALIGINAQSCYIAAKKDLKIPFWADLNGYILTEKFSASETEKNFALTMPPFYENLIFKKADKISTATLAQKQCILGKLSLINESNGFDSSFISHIPGAVFEHKPANKDKKAPSLFINKKNFNIFWCAGFNKWTDHKTLYKALEVAMDKNPRIRFISTVGISSRENKKCLLDFYENIQKGPHKEKFLFTPCLPKKQLEQYIENCDLGLICDKSNYETLIGARTRTNEMISQKMPLIISETTELSQVIKNNQLSPVYSPGNHKELARQIILAAENPKEFKKNAQKTYRYLIKYYNPEAANKPLLDWLKNL